MEETINDFERNTVEHTLRRRIPEITEFVLSSKDEHHGKPVCTIALVVIVENADFYFKYTSIGLQSVLKITSESTIALIDCIANNQKDKIRNIKMFFEEQIFYRYSCKYGAKIPIPPEDRAQFINGIIKEDISVLEMMEKLIDKVDNTMVDPTKAQA